MLEKLREFIRPLFVTLLTIVLLIGAVLSGVLELFWPGSGKDFTVGVAGWFRAIPDAYYQLTAAGMLGYTAGRSMEKITATKVKPLDLSGAQVPDDPDRRPS